MIDKCDTLQIMHFIGKDSDIYSNKYVKECDPIYLPLQNLPCVYFPFFYEKTEKSISQIKKLVPILEKYYKPKTDTSCTDPRIMMKSSTISLNIDNLLSKISNIIEDYQPYNNKNINYLTYSIYFFWLCFIFVLLKILYIKYISIYRYIIIAFIVIILIMCSVWALIVTSKNI